MMRKFFSIMMVVSLFTVQAHAVSSNGLKAAFDEMNFALTVEWDQKDKSFYDAQMKKFSLTVRDLQSKGLTNAQLIDFVTAEIKDEKVARDMKTTLSMIAISKMPAAEAASYMSEALKRSYSKGASWNGSTSLLLAAGVLLIVVAVAMGGSAGGNYGGGYCSDYYTCDTYCYDDYYWGYTCEDDCYYTCY